mgnify:FL=1
MVINLTTVITLFGTKLNYIRTGKLPTQEQPTALSRYMPSPRDREDADLRTTVQRQKERINELNLLLDRTRNEYESLKKSVAQDTVRQSQVTLLSGKDEENSSSEESSTSDSTSCEK